jgi:hypothetical protein
VKILRVSKTSAQDHKFFHYRRYPLDVPVGIILKNTAIAFPNESFQDRRAPHQITPVIPNERFLQQIDPPLLGTASRLAHRSLSPGIAGPNHKNGPGEIARPMARSPGFRDEAVRY